jgi:hypothetical protein
MITSIELAEARHLLRLDPAQAEVLLLKLEARLRGEEADFDGYCDRLDRDAAAVLAADAAVLEALDAADATVAAMTPDDGRVPCPECNGHDSRYCRTCDGIGDVPAPDCRARGGSGREDRETGEGCRNCMGTGKAAAPPAKGGAS